jgi:ribosomal protein L37AE/L43A
MRVNCPNCKKTKEVKGRYDNFFDTLIICKKCGFKVKGFCWVYTSKKITSGNLCHGEIK